MLRFTVCEVAHGPNHGRAMYGNAQHMSISLPSIIEEEYDFRLVLKTVLSVLSGCNGPPRLVCDGKRKVCVFDMGVCSCGPAILH